MKIKVVATNDVEVIVQPKMGGNWLSSEERSPENERYEAEEIQRAIRRHVDIRHAYINKRYLYQDENGEQHETLYDLLDSNLNEKISNYVYSYERESDNGVGTRGSTVSFTELIEGAFRNPYKFELISGEISDDQKAFLDKVVEAGLNGGVVWREV
jgi:hypothetical protein